LRGLKNRGSLAPALPFQFRKKGGRKWEYNEKQRWMDGWRTLYNSPVVFGELSKLLFKKHKK